ncbi:MAG: hypothetical protein CM1200mP21_02530 [Candidatus Poseidoniales archaeon]|nr:MAG: hypothetical protein CM1200mP21_02530 [Candidatus Poseidoniales archaeon]
MQLSTSSVTTTTTRPKGYIPGRDLYIDKELQMNERKEQERFSTVASLVSGPDVIAVGTVSVIYGPNPPRFSSRTISDLRR